MFKSISKVKLEVKMVELKHICMDCKHKLNCRLRGKKNMSTTQYGNVVSCSEYEVTKNARN